MAKFEGAGTESTQTNPQSYPGKGKMGPDGNKEKSSKGGFGVDAGNKNHMIQGTSAAPQVAGQSASQKSGGGKFAGGGSGHMFHDGNAANPAEPGTSDPTTADADAGKGGKFAAGGKTHMFGPQSAAPAKPA
jgi:hypothetical protein